MNFTSEQKEAILINDSCVVSAGAGSGKTAVLSERFVRLVSEGRAHCDRILAITFTKKAAAEMKSRIYSLLLAKGLNEELPLFKEASISTVDSLLHEIASKNCIRFGISPSFSVSDRDDFRDTEISLARKVLEKYTPSAFSSRILPISKIDDICSLFADIGDKFFSVTGTFDSSVHEKACLDVLHSSLADLTTTLTEAVETYIRDLSQDSKLTADVDMLKSFFEEYEKAGDDHLKRFQALSMIAFDRARGERDNAALAKELKDRIKELKKTLASLENAASDEAFIHTFYSALDEYHDLVISAKRELNTVTFDDVMQMALRILTESRSIRDSYKERFKYIMVDEFQDNNDNYRKLIYLLSEREDLFTEGIPEPEDLSPGKIFLVGDEKQSIYRFRGADVSVFKKMQKEIERAGGRMIELEKNFRTEPALLESFNIIFSQVMKDDGSLKDFEARFRHLQARDESFVKPHLIFYSMEKNEDPGPEKPLASASQSEAYGIAKLIKEMAGNPDFMISRKGEVRLPQYSDFAILFKTASSQSEYEKALRLNGIPYTVEESRSQTREALVNDFYSLLQIAVYINDPVSLAAFAAGPLSDGKSETTGPLSEADAQTVSTVKMILAQEGLTAALSWIWNCAAYRAFIITNPANQVYEEHYLWLYSLASSFEEAGKNAVEFLDYLRPFVLSAEEGAGKGRDVTVLRTEASGVSLMTVHKSKGLEFPIVIVAGTDSGSRNSSASLTFSEKDGFLFLPVFFTDNKLPVDCIRLLKIGNEEEQEKAELKRLLYVAATRSESHLIFSRSFKREAELTMASVLKEVLLTESVQEGLKDIAEFITEEQIEESLMYSYEHMKGNSIEKLKAWYEDAEYHEVSYEDRTAAVTSLISRPEGLSKAPLRLIQSDRIIREHSLQAVFGTLVHSCLEGFIKGQMAEAELSEVLSESEVSILKEDARRLALSFIESPLFRKIRESGMVIESEKPFVYYDEQKDLIVEGVIDLLVHDDKKAFVYDFKTDSYKNPLEHKEQLEIYEKAVKSIWEEKEIHSDVLYLREFL